MEMTGQDLYLANWTGSDEIWLNDGSGIFSNTNQILSPSGSLDVVLRDVDNDNDLDAIVANGYRAAMRYGLMMVLKLYRFRAIA